MSVIAKFLSADGLNVIEVIPEAIPEVHRACMYPITSHANEYNTKMTMTDRVYQLMGPLTTVNGRVYEYRECKPNTL